MPHEDIGPLAGEHVAQHAAAHAGDEADEDGQEQRIMLCLPVRALDADDREHAQADRVHHQQQPVEHRLVPPDAGAHVRQEHEHGHGSRREGIDGIVERRRRGHAENDVADNTAADRRADAEDDHAEQIHLLFDADNGAGNGKRGRADQFQHKNKNIGHNGNLRKLTRAAIFSARPARRARSARR